MHRTFFQIRNMAKLIWLQVVVLISVRFSDWCTSTPIGFFSIIFLIILIVFFFGRNIEWYTLFFEISMSLLCFIGLIIFRWRKQKRKMMKTWIQRIGLNWIFEQWRLIIISFSFFSVKDLQGISGISPYLQKTAVGVCNIFVGKCYALLVNL